MASGEQTEERAWKRILDNNKGAFLILFAELVGASMDAIARFLQLGGRSFHPFQVIFARMSITFILSSLYMWYTKVPDFPFGKPVVRGLLLTRALFGFFGLWCLYYSVHYLPLAEATVFRFLVPIVTAWACSLLLRTSFTWKELTAGIVALLGVVIIAQPAAIFGHTPDTPHTGTPIDAVTPRQRILAIAISVLGVLGASGAYTMIRVIGSRAHALISVNYFALVSTIGSTLILLLTPSLSFILPHGFREWALLILLGILGFILQFLLTAGLQLDKSSKATSMLYTQIIFALAFDWGIWGVLPGMWSCIGGAIVIGSTLWSALQKQEKPVKGTVKKADEETALLGAQAGDTVEGVQRRDLRISGVGTI
ncbi:hypothetical protein EJ08DRAFT_601093 [Tothia fuscella]|uniref:EamA domain-containing protein n=1 Tax=Tothia fuscella TaxID=1048955 RepID=A0A9P4NDH4_9PEZI|nr:hypothetical protein EJ08DRAFT_601093 [Tothia fuscella]